MNYHSDEWIRNGIKEHMKDASQYFDTNNIVGLFLIGSQNYGLDLADSDIDTRLMITPTLRQIAANNSPISTTFIRENNEHIEIKDVRHFVKGFSKQNLNFLEVMYSPYFNINPIYAEPWDDLLAIRDNVSHINPVKAVASMNGMAAEAHYNFNRRKEKTVESMAIFDKFGYYPKLLYNLRRYNYFIKDYINGKSIGDAMRPDPYRAENLIAIKSGYLDYDDAKKLADKLMENNRALFNDFARKNENMTDNKHTIHQLEDIVYQIMKISINNEN